MDRSEVGNNSDGIDILGIVMEGNCRVLSKISATDFSMLRIGLSDFVNTLAYVPGPL